jgi:hypothetical protein
MCSGPRPCVRSGDQERRSAKGRLGYRHRAVLRAHLTQDRVANRPVDGSVELDPRGQPSRYAADSPTVRARRDDPLAVCPGRLIYSVLLGGSSRKKVNANGPSERSSAMQEPGSLSPSGKRPGAPSRRSLRPCRRPAGVNARGRASRKAETAVSDQ